MFSLIYNKVKHSLHALVQSYEASVLMGLSLGLSGVFVLAALLIWLSQIWGAIAGCLIYAGVLLVIGLILKSVADRKEEEVKETLRQPAAQVALAAAPWQRSIRQLVGLTTDGSLLTPTLIFGIVLAMIYLAPAKSDKRDLG